MKQLFIYLLFYNIIFAQETFKATYSVTTSENEKAKDLPEHLKKVIKEADEAAQNLEPELIFNDSISIYKLKENSIVTNDLSVSLICNCKKSIFTNINTKETYKNSNKSLTVKEDEYLITDSLKTKWEITTETKKIDKFTFYKATQLITIRNGAKNSDGSPKIFTKTIIAWFSPEISYNFGPAGYGGLPGLIMELQDDNKLFGLQKLEKVLTNYKIEIPQKGIKVNNTEYNKILEQRTVDFLKKKEK